MAGPLATGCGGSSAAQGDGIESEVEQPAPAAGSLNRTYLPAVDHIRGLAALLILAYHGFKVLAAALIQHRAFTDDLWLHTTNPLLAFLVEGHTAVAGFMVLSGFILVQGTLGKELRYASFLRNRILRIYPLYGTLLAVGLCAHWPNFSLSGLVVSILPLGNFVAAAADLAPFSSMQWTIAVEFQFYLVFPFLLRFLEERDRSVFPLLLGVLILLRSSAVLLGADAGMIGYWTILGRMDQFMIGMLAGRWFARAPRRMERTWYLVVPAALALVGLVYGYHLLGGYPAKADWKVLWPTVEGAGWACFILCYLPAAARLPAVLAEPLRRVGLISFSIYLLHFIVISIVAAKGWCPRPFADDYGNALFDTVVVVLPLTLGCASLTYLAIEKPFLALRHRYT